MTHRPHLSTGAKVGIALAAVAGVCVLCAVMWFTYHNFRKPKSRPAIETMAAAPVELPAKQVGIELEAKHGRSEAAQGRESGFTEVFDMSRDDSIGHT